MTPSSPYRFTRVAVTAIVTALLVMTVGSCTSNRGTKHAEYCAMMPDSVGLYVGNPVTQMGYQIGEVKAISIDTDSAASVRVDFTVDEPRRLPADVKAVTRATSLLADRSLELVGNPKPGPVLAVGQCISLDRSFTPKSLAQVVGSTTKLLESLSPPGSTNIADTVRGLDQSLTNTGSRVNQLLTTSSSVLDSPDQTIGDIGAVVTNLAQLTDLLRELKDPVKQTLLDTQTAVPHVVKVVEPVADQLFGVLYLFKATADIEVTLGEPLQAMLDSTSVLIRKLAAHAPRVGNLMNVVPWWTDTVVNYFNAHAAHHAIRYRPPLYRIRTPDGVGLCNVLNASSPGSCANVQGTPYAVDVALLQYVLSEAAKRP